MAPESSSHSSLICTTRPWPQKLEEEEGTQRIWLHQQQLEQWRKECPDWEPGVAA